MPAFEYTALDRSGRETRGMIDADSLADARRKLRETRVHVLSVDAGSEEAPGPAPLVSRRISLRRIRSSDVASATRQLAMLMNAGIALVPALGGACRSNSANIRSAPSSRESTIASTRA